MKKSPAVPSWVFAETRRRSSLGREIQLTNGYYCMYINTWAMGCGTYVMDQVAPFIHNLPESEWEEFKTFLCSLRESGYHAKRFLLNFPEGYLEKTRYTNGCIPLLMKEIKPFGDKYENNCHESGPQQLYMWDLAEHGK